MSRIPCNVNKDLLPLYVDDVCSEESKALVEEHLAECRECQECYEALEEGISQETVTESRKKLLPEEGLEEAAVSIIKDIKKQISHRQVQAVCAVAAIAFIFIFVLEGLNGAYRGSELERFPLFDTRLKVSDMHVTELYQLRNGYLYITVETDKKFSILAYGNLNEILDKNNGFTGEYEGEIELSRKLWGSSVQMRKCSFIYPLTGKTADEMGEPVESEDSAIYLEGKGSERMKVWEKGQTVEKAPSDIEDMAKKKIEAEDAYRRTRKEDGYEYDREAYVIMDNESDL